MNTQQKFIVSLDQGTTSSRALLVDENAQIQSMEQQSFTQHFPQAGWVSHDAEEIYQSQLQVFESLLEKAAVSPENILGIGITNQRETTVVWNKHSGKPIDLAIVWQDSRTAAICESLKEKGLSEHVKKTTGLLIDAYFSATKVAWLLENTPGARALAEKGDLLMGTIDSWLLWKLTKGEVHATDYTNASRTMLFNIHTLDWDPLLLETLQIPASMLPSVYPSAHDFGHFNYQGVSIPICGMAGDQQAALIGQACFSEGLAKNTYGTGCFMLMNTGNKPKSSSHGLLSTIAYGIGGEVCYALEGSLFVAGAAVEWLENGLGMITHPAESEALANSLETENPVVMVPAFAGLGAPYWDMYARGAIFGLTRDTGKKHIVAAALEGLCFQTKDILDAMCADAGIQLKGLKVDGGASKNNYMLQFQSNLLGVPVLRPKEVEATALGAAYLVGIQKGLWTLETLSKTKEATQIFDPHWDQNTITRRYKVWQKAVERSKDWAEK